MWEWATKDGTFQKSRKIVLTAVVLLWLSPGLLLAQIKTYTTLNSTAAQ